MKKFMRIALVFALAGAALVGCTKDYSGDISDLNKEVSAIQSTLTSLQTSIQGAQSAADAAAATANTALSAAKAAATADDLKAVQTALAAAATADALKAVDDKYAAYIPAIEAAATADDLKALETAITAAIAATDVKVADLEKALEAYAKKADLDEAVTRIATLETNYIALEARVAKLEAAKEDIQKLIDDNAKGIETNAKAIEDLQKKVDELLAQGDGAFSIKSVSNQANNVNYFYAKWNPKNTKAEKEYFNKLANKFPELKEIEKGDVVASCTNVPFIVTPATLEFDETDSFSLVDINGKDFGWTLGKPFASPANVKAGTAGVWFAKVLAPAYNENGTIKNDANSEMALFVERADGSVAQTSFDYTVTSADKPSATTIAYHVIVNGDPYKAGDFEDNAYDLNLTDYLTGDNNTTTVYDNYYIIEPTRKVEVEKYGVSVDGKTLTVENLPKAGESIKLTFTKTAIMLDGRTAQSMPFTVTINGDAISANAELADQTVTLGYNAKAAGNKYEVAVDYAVKDFGFTALEWDTVFTALKTKTEKLFAERDDETFSDYDETDELGTDGHIEFLDKDKKVKASTRPVYNMAAVSSEDVAYIRFVINSQNAIPGEYSVKITDGKVFCAVGNVTVKNPTAKPVKIADKLCEDGVLLVVGGTPAHDFITYDLTNALVATDHLVGVVKTPEFNGYKFKDVAFEAATEETSDQKVEENWIASDEHTFKIPIWGKTWSGGYYSHNEGEEQKLLNTVREFAVYFNWFKNGEQNIDSLHFTAKAVSPVWTADGSNFELCKDGDPTKALDLNIYFNPGKDQSNTITLTPGVLKSVKYQAGNKKGTVEDVTYTKGNAETPFKSLAYIDEKVGDLTKVDTTLTFSNHIDSTNIYSNTNYLKDKNGELITIGAKELYDMGLLGYEEYLTRKTTWTYYVTADMWKAFETAWTSVYQYAHFLDNDKLCVWEGHYATASGQTVLEDAVKFAKDEKKAAADSIKKRIDKFDELIGTVKFGSGASTDSINVKKAYRKVNAKAESFGTAENVFDGIPTFTCEGDWSPYVTVTVNEGKEITLKVANEAAGKQNVEIPVYANIKDKWGMTTKKEIKVKVNIQ